MKEEKIPQTNQNRKLYINSNMHGQNVIDKHVHYD